MINSPGFCDKSMDFFVSLLNVFISFGVELIINSSQVLFKNPRKKKFPCRWNYSLERAHLFQGIPKNVLKLMVLTLSFRRAHIVLVCSYNVSEYSSLLWSNKKESCLHIAVSLFLKADH